MDKINFNLKISIPVTDVKNISNANLDTLLKNALNKKHDLFWECQDTIIETYTNSPNYKWGFWEECFDELSDEKFISYLHIDSKKSIIYYNLCNSDTSKTDITVELPLIFDWKTFTKDYNEDSYPTLDDTGINHTTNNTHEVIDFLNNIENIINDLANEKTKQ